MPIARDEGDAGNRVQSLHLNMMNRWHLLLLAALTLLSQAGAVAEGLQVPRFEGRITDTANVLSNSERARFTEMLSDYERDTGHQIAVLIIPTLSGEPIDSFSLRVAKSWQLGQKGVDNGILVTLAMTERRVRIELGAGMALFISDAEANAIIQESMIPAFRKGNYAGGIQAGLERLMDKARRFVVPIKESVPTN